MCGFGSRACAGARVPAQRRRNSAAKVRPVYLSTCLFATHLANVRFANRDAFFQ
jgi:predicted metal-binding protein